MGFRRFDEALKRAGFAETGVADAGVIGGVVKGNSGA